MAPEQASGSTDVDHRADIYALGVMIYEMLSGVVPHKGETTIRTLSMQMLEEPRTLRDANPRVKISNELDEAVMRALAKKKDERYWSMVDFLGALESATSDAELDLSVVAERERASKEGSAVSAEGRSPQDESAERRATTARAKRSGPSHERGSSSDPAFVGAQRTMPLVVDDDDEFERPRRGKGGLIFVVLLLLGGVAAGGYFALEHLNKEQENKEVAAVMDAASKPSTFDARVAVAAFDAGLQPADAAVKVAQVSDAAPQPVDKSGDSKPRKKDPPARRRKIEVMVKTIPAGGQLFLGTSYAGVDGTNIRRPKGTTLSVRCHKNGYVDGQVNIRFDGEQDFFTCHMRALNESDCVEGVKNPFNPKCKDS
jgi:hypothetical protein